MTPEQLFALICFTDSVECVNKIIFCLCRAHNQYDLTKNLTQFQHFRKPSNSFIYSLYTNQHSSYSPSEAAKRNQSERTHRHGAFFLFRFYIFVNEFGCVDLMLSFFYRMAISRGFYCHLFALAVQPTSHDGDSNYTLANIIHTHTHAPKYPKLNYGGIQTDRFTILFHFFW